ncbi:MAG: ATP-grasp domain-containing protein [Spirochaetes bacterium]|nr:ATP-grasp domain-containing protein [Spirochaetota bacterium]
MKVLVAFDFPTALPKDGDYAAFLKAEDWRPVCNVKEALVRIGHEVILQGVFDDIMPLIYTIRRKKPGIVFNMLETFKQERRYEGALAGLFDLLHVPYTGCSAAALTICRNKQYTKQLLSQYDIHVPKSVLFPRGKTNRSVKDLTFPFIVKPLSLEGSDGIAQASFVEDEKSLVERVKTVHETYSVDALVEEYIEGREIYAGVLGLANLTTLPLREMLFTNFPEDKPKFATFHAKWNPEFRKKWGIKNTFVKDKSIEKEVVENIEDLSKIAFRALGLSGFARLDLRLTDTNEIYVIEVNPNPNIANDDEIAYAAQREGISYDDLIKKIIDFGRRKT